MQFTSAHRGFTRSRNGIRVQGSTIGDKSGEKLLLAFCHPSGRSLPSPLSPCFPACHHDLPLTFLASLQLGELLPLSSELQGLPPPRFRRPFPKLHQLVFGKQWTSHATLQRGEPRSCDSRQRCVVPSLC